MASFPAFSDFWTIILTMTLPLTFIHTTICSCLSHLLEGGGGGKQGVRPVIIDTTLEGLGKGTGNLNTELMVDFLNRKKYYTYDEDEIFDIIDEYIEWIKKDHTWEYQDSAFMAGIFSSHANNIIYLQDKHRLGTKDIKNILSMIDPIKTKTL